MKFLIEINRNVNLRTQTNLVEIDYKNKQAIFEKLDKPGTFENTKVKDERKFCHNFDQFFMLNLF